MVTVRVTALEFTNPFMLVYTDLYLNPFTVDEAFVIISVLVVKFVYIPPSVDRFISTQVVPPSVLLCHLTAGVGLDPEALVNEALLPAQMVKPVGWELTAGGPVVSPIAKSPNVVSPVAWVLLPVAVPVVVIVHVGLL